MMRCKSTFCIVKDNIRGREFEPFGTGLSEVWCKECIKLQGEVSFFSSQTADMVRTTYNEYMETELPKEVKLILEQFTADIIRQLGGEL